MRDIVTLVSMAFVLVGMYLVLSKGRESVNIIDTLAKNATAGIKTLQGR